jgi:flagellar motor switch protein FliN/FliY
MGAIAATTLTALPTASLKLIKDVEMDITVELGRTKMAVRNILSLVPGSVIELDRAAGAPVDLLVNGTLIGRGEVVVIDEEFGVRISEIIGRTED